MSVRKLAEQSNKEIAAVKKQMPILVVDSDEAFRESIANFLLTCGFEEFEIASSLVEAAGKISRTFFDIILVDLFMPNMKGLHFMQELRKLSPETKIILLIEDRQLLALDDTAQAKLNLPIVLKSLVSRNLPQLLSEESSAMVLAI